MLGVWLTRSAGCVINDYADRWLDPQVARTRARPLATGAVSAREALAVFAAMMLAAFALVLFTNRLTIYLSVVGGAAGRELSVPEALHLPAAGVPGHGLRLGHPDGLRRDPGRRCRRWPGCCSWPTCCGPPATTPGTRWSTATTTCAPARSPPRSCSATPTWSRRACCMAASWSTMFLLGQRAGLGVNYLGRPGGGGAASSPGNS